MRIWKSFYIQEIPRMQDYYHHVMRSMDVYASKYDALLYEDVRSQRLAKEERIFVS
jgi:hypothetical protein